MYSSEIARNSERPSIVEEKNYKVLLVGDGGTGKTTYITRIIDGNFEREYFATSGAIARDVVLSTNKNYRIRFKVWDIAGQDMLATMNDAYYKGADAALIFFDLTSRVTLINAPKWVRKLGSVCGETDDGRVLIPIVLCGNKADLPNSHKIKRSDIESAKCRGIKHCVTLSAKSNLNFDLPFRILAEELTGDTNLVFTFDVGITPATIPITEESAKESIKLMEEMRNITPDLLNAEQDDTL